MIPPSAWSAPSLGNTKIGPGAHCVLLALWDHAHRWKPGLPEVEDRERRFVWPSARRLAAKLGIKVRAVYASVRKLLDAGWIAEVAEGARKGWRVMLEPAIAAVEAEANEQGADTDPRQLGFAWADEEAAPELAANDVHEHAPLKSAACARVRTTTAHEPAPIAAAHPLQSEQKSLTTTTASGGEADRIWSDYESERVRLFGGTHRRGRAPQRMHELAASLGGDAAAWATVERYGRFALKSADAQRDPKKRKLWIGARADGHEWDRERYNKIESHMPSDAPRRARAAETATDERAEAERREGERAFRARLAEGYEHAGAGAMELLASLGVMPPAVAMQAG